MTISGLSGNRQMEVRRATGGTATATFQFLVTGSTTSAEVKWYAWNPQPVSGPAPNGGYIGRYTWNWQLTGPVSASGTCTTPTGLTAINGGGTPGVSGIVLSSLPVGTYELQLSCLIAANSIYTAEYPAYRDSFVLSFYDVGTNSRISSSPIHQFSTRIIKDWIFASQMVERDGTLTQGKTVGYNVGVAGGIFEATDTLYVDSTISAWRWQNTWADSDLNPMTIEVSLGAVTATKAAGASMAVNDGNVWENALYFTDPRYGIPPFGGSSTRGPLSPGTYAYRARITVPSNGLANGSTANYDPSLFIFNGSSNVTSISPSAVALVGDGTPGFNSITNPKSFVGVLSSTPSANVTVTNMSAQTLEVTALDIVEVVGSQSWVINNTWPGSFYVTAGQSIYALVGGINISPGTLLSGSSTAKLRVTFKGIDNITRYSYILLESTTIPPDLGRTGEFVRYPKNVSTASETTVPNLTRWNYLATFTPSGDTGDVTFDWSWDGEYLGSADIAMIQVNNGGWVPFSSRGYSSSNPGSLTYTDEMTGVPVKIFLSGITRKVGTANFSMDITAPNVDPASFPDTLEITEPVVLAYPREGGIRYKFIAGMGAAESYLLSALDRKLTFNLKSPDTVDFKLNMRNSMLPYLAELATDIKVYRDDLKIFRGRVGPSTSAIDGKSGYKSFNAFDYRGVLERRFTEDDDQIYWYNEDVGVIVWDLITFTQARTAGDLGIVQGLGLPTLGTIREEVEFQPGSSIAGCINTIAESKVRGFDWYVNPEMELDLYGERGEQIPKMLEYTGAITSLTGNYDTSQFANAARASGGEIVDAVLLEAPDLLTDVRGRWEAQVSWPDVETQEVLNDRTQYLLEQVNVVPESFNVKLREGFWRGPDHVWIGDYVLVKIEYGNFSVNKSVRVHTLTIELDGNGGEAVSLELK